MRRTCGDDPEDSYSYESSLKHIKSILNVCPLPFMWETADGCNKSEPCCVSLAENNRIMKRVAIFGMGYVGCVTAAGMGHAGHHVIGVDIDAEKLSALDRGSSPVCEPGLDDFIRQEVEDGLLETTSDVEQAVQGSDVALITVGTPSSPNGGVVTQSVERVIESIGQALSGTDQDYVVVMRSTLLPGILEETLGPLLENAIGEPLGHRVHLCNNPEFLRETTGLRDYDEPPFILVGTTNDECAQAVLELYGDTEAERIVTDTRTAAMVKYACNAFHALKVNFANEIGRVSQECGIDGQAVMDIVCRDHQLNISPAYLRPGFAFGGSCLPKDVRALVRFAQRRALGTELLNAILPSNDEHLQRGLKRIRDTGHRKVGLIGLSFKAGTDDLRESPLVILAETMLGQGYDLKIYDPYVRATSLKGTNLAYVDRHLPHLAALLVDDPDVLFDHADVLLIGTDVADDVDHQNKFYKDTIDLRRDLVNGRHVTEPIK